MTDRNREALEYIRSYERSTGRQPTTGQIALHLGGISKQAADRHIDKLIIGGFLTKRPAATFREGRIAPQQPCPLTPAEREIRKYRDLLRRVAAWMTGGTFLMDTETRRKRDGLLREFDFELVPTEPTNGG